MFVCVFCVTVCVRWCVVCACFCFVWFYMHECEGVACIYGHPRKTCESERWFWNQQFWIDFCAQFWKLIFDSIWFLDCCKFYFKAWFDRRWCHYMVSLSGKFCFSFAVFCFHGQTKQLSSAVAGYGWGIGMVWDHWDRVYSRFLGSLQNWYHSKTNTNQSHTYRFKQIIFLFLGWTHLDSFLSNSPFTWQQWHYYFYGHTHTQTPYKS